MINTFENTITCVGFTAGMWIHPVTIWQSTNWSLHLLNQNNQQKKKIQHIKYQ